MPETIALEQLRELRRLRASIEALRPSQATAPSMPEAPWDTRFLILVLEHPEWTIEELATAVGVTARTVHNRPDLKSRRKAIRGVMRKGLPSIHETRDVRAADESDD